MKHIKPISKAQDGVVGVLTLVVSVLTAVVPLVTTLLSKKNEA